MSKNDILEQMGVQQWRLREKPLSVSKEVSDPFVNQVPLEVPSDELNKSEDNFVSDLSPEVADEYDWSALIKLLEDKQFCGSCSEVTPILGDGNPNADWMFIFDSPSKRDIEQQLLLTGRVGQLFDAILLVLGLNRENIYLSTIFKCPPSANISSEIAKCDSLLQHQITLVQPKVVIAFGEFAAQAIIKANEDLDQLRQQQRHCFNQPIVVIPTFSLMQMLDTPLTKAKVWSDLKKALAIIEE